MPLEITLTNEQQVSLTATPTTPAGHPVAVDGAVQFTVQSGDCTLQSLSDTSTMIVSSDAPGDSTILVAADADLGEGTENIQDVVIVHVQGAKAQNLGLVVGVPENKP